MGGQSIHIDGPNAKGALQRGAAACYPECMGKKGFPGSFKLNSIYLMNIPVYDLHTGSPETSPATT